MSDLLQILKATSAKPRVTFYSGGVASDLDSGVPTVTITRPDGSTIASGTVTHVGAAGSGQYEFTLSSASTATPTLLTVTWAGPIGGVTQTLTSYVEVLGALLFTLPEFRALRVAGDTPFASTSTWPDDRLHEARAATLDEFEEILGFSPVPRFQREVHSLAYRGDVILGQLHASQVLSVNVGGVAQTPGNYLIDKGGRLLPVTAYTVGPWVHYGYGDLVVEYVAGWPRAKGDGSQVAMLRAAMRLDPGLSSTASSVTTPDGVSYSFDPAGQVTRAGTVRHFGVPAIDSWLNRWARLAVA